MVELTERDFEIFKDEAQYWIDKFGLLDWRIDFDFAKLDDDRSAQLDYMWKGKCCCICLNKWPLKRYSEEEIKQSAFHEVCELLLVELRRTALDEEIPYEERAGLTDAAAHGVIRRLENSVFKMKQ